MAKVLLTSGNAFKRTDNRWGGVVWYQDEDGERKRKSFSSTTKQGVKDKMTKYIRDFEKQEQEANESNEQLQLSMQRWLEVFKYPTVERTTYDRIENTAKNHIYPALGKKIVSNIKAVDIKKILNEQMMNGYAFTTVKKTRDIFGEYFRYLIEQEVITKNPMQSVPMIKKSNFYAQQGKEILPTTDTITVFTEDEIVKLKAECKRTWSTGKRFYQQSAAYIFMLNTGLRTGEMLGLKNSDIDLENRVVYIQRGAKEIYKRDGVKATSGREVVIGKTKSATSNRVVPLNNTAVEMVKELREEFYFGEDSPLVPDEHGNFTKPSNFRKRFYRILDGAGIEHKGLHSLRHTFATNLVNGVKQPDGTVKSLTPKEVADLLGHCTSEITERYYVKRDNSRLNGITDGFEM
ncbi:MAG: site-specific integrase [Ruminococcus sp.]|nr:site-specific integrase [Ruminococcus sp.]